MAMLQLRWNLAGGSNSKIRAANFNPHKRRKKARDFHALAPDDANKMMVPGMGSKEGAATSPQQTSTPSPEQKPAVEAPANGAPQQWTFLPLTTPSEQSSSSIGDSAVAAEAPPTPPMAHVVVGPKKSPPIGSVVVACAVKPRIDRPRTSPPPPPLPEMTSDVAVTESLNDDPDLQAYLGGSDTDVFSAHGEDSSDYGGDAVSPVPNALELEYLETNSLLTELLGPTTPNVMEDLCGFDDAALEAHIQSSDDEGAAGYAGA